MKSVISCYNNQVFADLVYHELVEYNSDLDLISIPSISQVATYCHDAPRELCDSRVPEAMSGSVTVNAL
jgi:hypothetical protein